MIKNKNFSNDTLANLLMQMGRFVGDTLVDDSVVLGVNISMHVEEEDDNMPYWFEGSIFWREGGLKGE